MNEVYMTDGTLERFKELIFIINTWAGDVYSEPFTETQILEICIGFTLASMQPTAQGYPFQSILKSAVVACDLNRKR